MLSYPLTKFMFCSPAEGGVALLWEELTRHINTLILPIPKCSSVEVDAGVSLLSDGPLAST
ncbi:MAG: hypothetical protein Ct9H90mP30_1990 [Actinomycetota bacterium]|nr:MAG: hypothetical protein Ct9H90mP30_1990 [Actinomycetota bacterium]